MKQLIDMSPLEAANTSRPRNVVTEAMRQVEAKIKLRAAEGNFRSFTTAELMRAAKTEWGESSPITRSLYKLLLKMVVGNDSEKI